MTHRVSDEPVSSDRQAKRSFWARFTAWSGAATAGVFTLPFFFGDVCSSAYGFAVVAWMVVPLVAVVGLIGLAARSPSGSRGWPVFGALLLSVVWILWLFILAGVAGMMASACL